MGIENLGRGEKIHKVVDLAEENGISLDELYDWLDVEIERRRKVGSTKSKDARRMMEDGMDAESAIEAVNASSPTTKAKIRRIYREIQDPENSDPEMSTVEASTASGRDTEDTENSESSDEERVCKNDGCNMLLPSDKAEKYHQAVCRGTSK